MGKKYLIILVGFILTFALLTGCGMTRTVQRTQTSDDSSTQREEELQAEIDALQKEIDDLKGSQGSQDQQNTDRAGGGQRDRYTKFFRKYRQHIRRGSHTGGSAEYCA